MTPAKHLARLRKLCMALPDVTEKVSHGAETWFVGAGKTTRSFATFSNNHHGDGRVALVCAAPDGVQAQLVADDPDAYYVPPYVGPSGWIGILLDAVPVADLQRAIEHAYAVAAAKLAPRRR